eukprot:TRINITY_DN56063_c0_g1_i1.p1 TRINITY_DN56063_c0_g1~~TRINITY_DN56063_c0_g1_i1.p1  ORF type:complete len:504 (+),score=114.37 TRINITY_DN56063_c0_g1_i1:138-1649(+)
MPNVQRATQALSPGTSDSLGEGMCFLHHRGDGSHSETSSGAARRRSTVMRLPPTIDPTLDAEERRSLLSGDEDAPRRVSLASVTFNFAKTAMGVGILSIAGTLALSGLALGLTFIALCACVALFAVRLMLDAARITRATTYEGLAEVTLGTTAKVLIQASVIIVLFFANLAYLVVSKHFLHTGLGQWGVHVHANVLLIPCVLLVIPITMLPDLDSLRYTSLFGIAAFFAFVITSAVWLGGHYGDTTACEELDQHPKTGHPSVPTQDVVLVNSVWQDALNSFNVIAMSFSWHPAVFPVAEEVVQYDSVAVAHSKLSTGSFFAACVLVVIYASAGLTGYLQWYDCSPWASSILACYPAKQPIFIVLYISMALVCLVSFPLLLHFIRLIVANIVYKGESNDLPTGWRVAFNLCFTLCTAGLAAVMDNLITVFSVGGALGLPLMCYLMPPAAFLKAAEMARTGEVDCDCPSPGPKMIFGAKGLLCMGMLLQVASLYTAGRSLAQGNT